MVYDCGTLNEEHYIKNAIKSSFIQGEDIDLLIISHFDIDHIKGIPF
ncbi:MBL fold metallo-hydrolase [Bacteroides nordii]